MPHYTTFYSFKGGVGRTHALLNTAIALQRRSQKRVLIWEADLEAPGLLSLPYFAPVRNKAKGGLLDALTGADPTDFILEHDGLHLFPAGQPGKAYETAFGKFQEKFAADPTALGHRFDQIRVQLETFQPTHVLIDSRTGLTDIGAICTVQLADLVVLVFRLGQQDIEGTRNHWTLDERRLKAIRRTELQTRLVASMVPLDQPELTGQRLHAAAEAGLKVHYQVPLVPEYLLLEKLPVVDHPGTPAAEVFEKLAREIEALAEQQEIDQEPAIAAPGRRDRDRHNPGRDFEENVARVLRFMGFEVQTDVLISGRQVDFLAIRRDPLQEIHWLGECKDYSKGVGVEAIDATHSRLAAYRKQVPHAQGVIVARTGFTKEADARAKELGISLKTYGELLNGLIDLRPYVPALIRDVAGQEIERLYVDPAVFPESTRQLSGLDAFLDHWLADPSSTHLTLLGDYGTGKTWFTRRLAARLAEAWQKDPARHRCPIRIDLGAASRALSLENVIYEHFQRQYGRLVDPQAVLHLLAEGRFVLIFDAFDEMVTQANWDVTAQTYRELARAARGRAKVIVTCRTHFFRTQDEVAAIVEGRTSQISAEARSFYGEVFGKTGFSLAYLRDFDPDRIEHYLKLAGASSVIPLLSEIAGLKEIAGRPVLLDMIVKSAPKLRKKETVKLATLYETYTEEWLARSDWRSSLGREDRLRMAQKLAVRLWETDGARLHHSEVRLAVAELLRERAKNLDEIDVIETEVRTASFFTWKDVEGHFGFSDRSFLAFFLAQWIARRMTEGDSAEALRLRRLSPDVISFLVDLCPRETLGSAVNAVLETTYLPRASQNALALYKAAGLPRPARFELAGADLAGWRLPDSDLSSANLRGASLIDADLSGANLESADLTGSDLTRSFLDRVRAAGARFTDAILAGTSLVDAELADADLNGANFQFALAVGTSARLRLSSNRSGPRLGLSADSSKATAPVVQSFESGVVSIDWDPSGSRIAFAAGATVMVADSCTLSIRRVLQHKSEVKSVHWSKDGKHLASGCDDGFVWVWDTDRCSLTHEIKAHEGWTSCVRWNHGGLLASTGSDRVIRVWQASDGCQVQTLKGHGNTVLEIDWSVDGDRLASGSMDGTARVWQVESGKQLQEFVHRFYVGAVAWHPGDEARLATGAFDSKIRLWDVKRGTALSVIEGHQQMVRSLAWMSAGNELVSASADGEVRVSVPETGTGARLFGAHPSDILEIRLSPTRPELAIGGWGAVGIWDMEGAQPPRLRSSNSARVSGVSQSGDQKRVASCGHDKAVRLWDADTGKQLQRRGSQEGIVTAICWHEEGRLLATGGGDSKIRIWTARDLEPKRVLEGHQGWVHALAWVGKGAGLASAGSDLTIRVWDTQKGNLLRLLNGDFHFVTSVCASPNGKLLASCGKEGGVRVWNWQSGDNLATFVGHQGQANAVSWSGDTNLLASGGSEGEIRFWDFERQSHVMALEAHHGGVTCLAWGAGERLVSGGEDRTVRLWDVAGRRELLKLSVGARVMSIDWRSGRLAVALENGSIQLWDTERWALLASHYGFDDGAWLVIRADGTFDGDEVGLSRLAFAGPDWTLYPSRLWPDKRGPVPPGPVW